MSKILKKQVHVSAATGRVYWIDENGRAHLDAPDPETEKLEPWMFDAYLPTCPLEERGSWRYDD